MVEYYLGVPSDLWLIIGGVIAAVSLFYISRASRAVNVRILYTIPKSHDGWLVKAKEDLQGIFVSIVKSRKVVHTLTKSALAIRVKRVSDDKGRAYILEQDEMGNAQLIVHKSGLGLERWYLASEGNGETIPWDVPQLAKTGAAAQSAEEDTVVHKAVGVLGELLTLWKSAMQGGKFSFVMWMFGLTSGVAIMFALRVLFHI